MKEIPLSLDQVALVDDEDFEWLSQWKWSARKSHNTFYAQRNVNKDGKRTSLQMHRAILGAVRLDHKDGNGLNNCRSNLRPATSSQNGQNTGRYRTNTSGHKGVTWDKRRQKWLVQHQVDGHKKHVGYFDDVEEAGRAYREAVSRVFGEYASVRDDC